MTLRLILPDVRYRDTFLEGCRALNERDETEGAPDNNGHAPNPLTDFDDYIAYIHAQAKGQRLPEGYVPVTNLWLMDGDTFIARGNIRHELNDFLLNYGGHIGYAVVPAHRGKGYGKKLLALMLIKAGEMGINPVLVTCNDNNAASAGIIEANGGVLENIVDDKVSNNPGDKLRRYWISLAPASAQS